MGRPGHAARRPQLTRRRPAQRLGLRQGSRSHRRPARLPPLPGRHPTVRPHAPRSRLPVGPRPHHPPHPRTPLRLRLRPPARSLGQSGSNRLPAPHGPKRPVGPGRRPHQAPPQQPPPHRPQRLLAPEPHLERRATRRHRLGDPRRRPARNRLRRPPHLPRLGFTRPHGPPISRRHRRPRPAPRHLLGRRRRTLPHVRRHCPRPQPSAARQQRNPRHRLRPPSPRYLEWFHLAAAELIGDQATRDRLRATVAALRPNA